MVKKKLKRMGRDAISLTGSGVTMGVGAGVLEGIGGTAATYGATGVSRMASFMPTIGTVVGAGYALGALEHLQPKRKKRRR